MPPAISVEIVRDRTAESRASGGFLDVQRLDLVARFPDGSESAPFPYDIARRSALDVAIMAAYFNRDGVFHVFLRSSLRPPCVFRAPPLHHDGLLWELPAGLIEPDEEPIEAAARELREELGFTVARQSLRPLGEWVFPAPGMIGERHVFFAVEVDPASRGTPSEDGSALEHGAVVLALPLRDALDECRRGVIRDEKTELALRRLSEMLS